MARLRGADRALPPLEKIIDHLGARRIAHRAQVDAQAEPLVGDERAPGEADGHGRIAWAEAVDERLLLDLLRQEEVEEAAGGLPLLGRAPGGVQDVIGVLVPQVAAR